ncbi:MAG: cardiolipin synthase [Acidobacteriaceae bacterium]|nr:cardiolipin synthase [Acidobacteriaceae bacterium]
MYAIVMMVSISTGLFVLGVIAIIFLVAFLLSGIFGPTPKYDIANRDQLPANDSAHFLVLVESMVDAKVNRTGTLEVLKNGPAFYTAALDAIRNARGSVNLEAYIFQKSAIGRQYLEAMTEQARSGVSVNVVLDAFGSAGATRAFFRPLLDAGGKVNWYNSPAWHRLTRLDNRTHRELLIVDGRIGFIGGAGIADQWFSGSHGQPRWRDTMVRVQGEAVPNLQATFAENWLAASGELLTGDAHFPDIACPDKTVAMVVNSTPTVGGSTRARVLFQLLLASAKHSISITTPYFLPDNSLTRELCRAIEDRGVKVRILVPGRKSDHLLTRSTSRGGYGPLLRAGAEVYEYQPSMIHAKVLCIDGLWSVVGSTNFDNRSFGINDEVNLAVCDPAFAGRLEQDMSGDIAESRRVSLDEWRHRPVTERAPELLGWLFERQQ